MAEDLSELPPILRRIAEACGLGVALQLGDQFGGIPVYIPKEAAEDCVLVRAIGAEAVAKMIKEFNSGHLEIPLGPFGNRKRVWRAIRQNLREGRSNTKTARAVGVHQRTVSRHRGRVDDDLPLFDRVSKDD
ncbi:hypothetical protein [Hypericibacter sp.]|uniref:hypothetical protein n=1 Tax=Hypericibacter sp. TaxID=2705401 RepID=UPI003D6D1F8D